LRIRYDPVEDEGRPSGQKTGERRIKRREGPGSFTARIRASDFPVRNAAARERSSARSASSLTTLVELIREKTIDPLI
jgi:hypothetical protein